MDEVQREENIELTSGEIGFLWETYQYESLAICGLKYFLVHINDMEIQKILEKGLKLSEKRVSNVIDMLTKENHPIPEGFTEGDVNLKAPRLFSDQLYLEYLLHTLQLEFFMYSHAMLIAAKLPIQQFFDEVMKDTMNLEMEAKELTKQKGLFLRVPSVPPIKNVEYIEKESFLAGWFGDRRPLLAIEISQLVFNAKRNSLGQAVITGFSQVAKSQEVREYFTRGRDIAGKHVEAFSGKLREEYLNSSSLLKTDQVTDSTEAPFSDKLMMNFITVLISSGIGDYGASISMSPRRDLGVMYTRLMAEVAKYSNDGAELLIKNAWLEKPPMAADREGLAKKSSE